MERFAYFTLRLRLAPALDGGASPPLSGVVERLETGETQSFYGAEELLRVLSSPLVGSAKMPPSDAAGNSDPSRQYTVQPRQPT